MGTLEFIIGSGRLWNILFILFAAEGTKTKYPIRKPMERIIISDINPFLFIFYLHLI